jgi:hypothetical protein
MPLTGGNPPALGRAKIHDRAIVSGSSEAKDHLDYSA